MKVLIRLEFNHIYKDEEKKDVLDYLKNISRFTLENVIGFFSTNPVPNFDNFFTNPKIQSEVFNAVVKYSHKHKIIDKPELISAEGSLMLSEQILANKEILLLNNDLDKNIDRDEINLFKAFLVINEYLNKSNNLTLNSTTDSIEKIAEIIISLKFSTSDLGIYENIDIELLKLVFVTSYKFEKLIQFLRSNDDYAYLIEDLCLFYKQNTIEDLIKQVDYLILQVLMFRSKKSYKFLVEDNDTTNFLNSLISEEIIIETDFKNLRNFPLYKIEENTFSIINPFLVLDKFTKSLKFFLKESYMKKNNVDFKDRGFFDFYNKGFSENYLMKNLMENIFYKKYYVKQETLKNKNKEPDYYFRNNNDIYIFEYKDTLIAKEIKASGDKEKILEALKGKFLINPNNNKRIGIGQIINHIESISNNTFAYDSKLISEKSYTIYPILLLSDRSFEIHGINYILNNWFINNLNKDNHKLNIKNLIIIDIDTMIFYQEFFKLKDKNFKTILDEHIAKMKMNTNGYGKSLTEFEKTTNKKVTKKLSPFSSRFNNTLFEEQLFIDKFSYLVSQDDTNIK